MATIAQWAEGARLRTLPLAIAPVLIGTGAAFGAIGGFSSLIIGSVDPADRPELGIGTLLFRALLAVIVSLGLQIGSNFANDYSDGIRGTDDVRVGPQRLTASGAVPPGAVKRAAFISFGVAALAGIVLVLVSQSWWFVPVGILAVLAAWFYTGGGHPYGYYALGEVFVFIFFGLVATLGTTYVMIQQLPPAAWAGAVAIGLFSCAVLMVNNLRDIPTDSEAGKTTLAVLLGDQRARAAYTLLVAVPYLLLLVPILSGHPAAVLAALSLVLAIGPLQTVLSGSQGTALIPPIKNTGLTALTYSALLALGLAL
ncbi:1,4-dihydroxy-2-naphthoate polyprenyltransferase [Nocardia zapadnayensis]|uniref:1,4-dihydroxy-2-naphthoate polyprenyltransferase n=1 Tax=Brevibacterium sp. R8603A2 TaxID=2929779 RepID=UPI001FFC191B|nr:MULTISPECIES: 1,4-dihydroxy-2-naphthoate polyprenyltransferase [Actinomycetes]MCK1803105.1 1,4-dihydroxy-2-naphthoate polyprenyltransferase [Brevibacterium sp. R8603A2]MCX0277198.1 1,4-dihydroxy-2-naphthoate polyprenyltransferase [Nocardia zapadnayensis]